MLLLLADANAVEAEVEEEGKETDSEGPLAYRSAVDSSAAPRNRRPAVQSDRTASSMVTSSPSTERTKRRAPSILLLTGLLELPLLLTSMAALDPPALLSSSSSLSGSRCRCGCACVTSRSAPRRSSSAVACATIASTGQARAVRGLHAPQPLEQCGCKHSDGRR